MHTDIKKQCVDAAKGFTPDEAKTMLENYVAVHTMREVVGWWSQSGEACFKRALGVRAGLVKANS